MKGLRFTTPAQDPLATTADRGVNPLATKGVETGFMPGWRWLGAAGWFEVRRIALRQAQDRQG